jgi:copper chaperone CopZ
MLFKMKKITFKIVGMHCTSCSIAIDGDLEDTEGVKRAHTSYAKAQTEVEFDPDKISEKQLASVIKNTGYTVEPL